MLDSFIILGKTANVPKEVMAIIGRRPRTGNCCACAAYGLPRESCYWRRMLEMCAYACLLFLLLFFQDSAVHSFLGESEIASQGLSVRRWGMMPLVRILCKIQSFSTILFIYWWHTFWNEGKCILCRNAFLFFVTFVNKCVFL